MKRVVEVARLAEIDKFLESLPLVMKHALAAMVSALVAARRNAVLGFAIPVVAALLILMLVTFRLVEYQDAVRV